MYMYVYIYIYHSTLALHVAVIALTVIVPLHAGALPPWPAAPAAPCL